jgi:hypothetical protein
MIKVKTRVISSVLVLIPLFIAGGLEAGEKTMQRVDDPVVMECKDLGPLFGSPINKLALMVWNGDTWSPIPFQIDQKKPDGSYAYTMGPEASTDPDPNLDANDELVFMVKDTGDSVENGGWPKGAEKVMEIEVIDPKNSARGWVYLVGFSGKAPRSEDDYIERYVDETKGHRGVRSYEYTGGAPMDTTAIDLIKAETTSEGKRGLDVLDRLKIRGVLIFPGGITVPINADEMIKTEDKAFIDGPVRVLQLADGYMLLGPIKVRGTGYSVVKYYVNSNTFPVYIKTPELPDFLKGLMPKAEFTAFLDFNSNVDGSHSFSPANPYNDKVVLDGRMSEAEKNLDTDTPIDWIAGFGPQGAIISRLLMGEVVGAKYKKVTYYMDDETKEDPPEDHKGVRGVGYLLAGEGEYVSEFDFTSIIYFKKELQPEEVHKILDILDHPVTVSARQVR